MIGWIVFSREEYTETIIAEHPNASARLIECKTGDAVNLYRLEWSIANGPHNKAFYSPETAQGGFELIVFLLLTKVLY